MRAPSRRGPVSTGRDLALAGASAVLVTGDVWIAHLLGAVPPTPLTFVAAALIAVPLLVRSRYPLGVLLVATGLLLVFYIAYPTAGLAPAIPLGVALYGAAQFGHLRWALAVSLFFTIAGMIALISGQHLPAVQVVTNLVQQGSLLGAICLLGDAVYNRRGWAAEVRDRLAEAARAAAVEQDREAARRVGEERLRIARDLHDVLAHTISALTIQARVVKDGVPDAAPPVRAALDAILHTSREAMSEVRAAVGLLRAPDEPGSTPPPPAPGLAQLEAVLTTARANGLRARCDLVGTPVTLPPPVELTAYRIVQEALTNVVRHAGATAVTVTLNYQPDLLEIRIDDDGRGPVGATAPSGYGLVGMRERAAVLGGAVEAGAGPDGGFRVSARLPAQVAG